MTIQDLAKQALTFFEMLTREDGTRYQTLKDDRPDWLQDLVYAAHDDELPNDWRYRETEAIISSIADGADEDDRQIEPDVYTSGLLLWLADRLGRADYFDRAVEDYGPAATLVEGLQRAQLLCLEEMFGVIWRALEEESERSDAATEEVANA